MAGSGAVSGSVSGSVSGADRLRVADADRARVASVLERAHAEGRLTLAEYDERVRAAHGAVVRADLTPLTADLPELPAPAAAAPSTRRAATTPLRAAIVVWATVSVINLVIWVAVSVGTGGAVAPWWIWVAGPWGAVLAVHALATRAGFAPPVPFACAGPRASRR
ncbi:DUF1707 SHOCT-like domain-containing protein [Actinomycetospora lemnae]|uniref:DUF1707 domain-containing protein n=1 Tax=Actinomycetospora lemnae TaxID=3019891 RepID=A0ABT5SVB9_9PSEU|nr:DUF1707 domain-containing protein [Actinomycetospora sp. DW7H6]MDD7966076.1 DUF1707 domain-containing protein [Actinomycetospora sp. DW7H6]